MVRLKLKLNGGFSNFISLFQFLNGSIKADYQDEFRDILLRFQFLNGSIKARQIARKLKGWSPVSIPQWFD